MHAKDEGDRLDGVHRAELADVQAGVGVRSSATGRRR